MLGKKIRMERVMDRNTRKTVMVPLIHGVGMGPIEGIRDIKNCVDTVALGGANAVILHKGIVASAHRRSGKDIGLVLNLTATLENGEQALVTDVEEALSIGAALPRSALPMRLNSSRAPKDRGCGSSVFTA